MNFPAIPSSSSWNGDKFSLFVGNLPSGLEDGWLERILGVSLILVLSSGWVGCVGLEREREREERWR